MGTHAAPMSPAIPLGRAPPDPQLRCLAEVEAALDNVEAPATWRVPTEHADAVADLWDKVKRACEAEGAGSAALTLPQGLEDERLEDIDELSEAITRALDRREEDPGHQVLRQWPPFVQAPWEPITPEGAESQSRLRDLLSRFSPR